MDKELEELATAFADGISQLTARMLALERLVFALTMTHPDRALALSAIEKMLESATVKDLNSSYSEPVLTVLEFHRGRLLSELRSELAKAESSPGPD